MTCDFRERTGVEAPEIWRQTEGHRGWLESRYVHSPIFLLPSCRNWEEICVSCYCLSRPGHGRLTLHSSCKGAVHRTSEGLTHKANWSNQYREMMKT